MSPSAAALLTTVLVAFLFLQDPTRKDGTNGALWLPVLWMAVTGSRFVSQWMNLGTTVEETFEGSPLDAAYFLTLIVTGSVILARRHLLIAELVRNNRWLVAFLLYSLLAILWSDFHFIALKRWVKTLGHPIMALIILTDPDPALALRIVMKRCAYLLMPFSVLMIKYFPEYGRGFDNWTGTASNSGVALNKNGLGYICLIFGLFFVWNLLVALKIGNRRARLQESVLSIGFLGMIGWLFSVSNSATSMATFAIGATTIIVIGWRIVSKRHIGLYVLGAILLAAMLESVFDVYSYILYILGRTPDLTDRTEVWSDVLALQPNVLWGAGFESFWLGPRLDALWEKWWWHPNQAHNGYIETYLNLGAIGVFLLLGLLVSTFRKISAQLATDLDFNRLRLGFLLAIVFYNYTEATFKAVHLVWTIFMIIAIDYPRKAQTDALSTSRNVPRSGASHLIADQGRQLGRTRHRRARDHQLR
jgi:exopolysaccharide production protein ExoQ